MILEENNVIEEVAKSELSLKPLPLRTLLRVIHSNSILINFLCSVTPFLQSHFFLMYQSAVLASPLGT